MNTVKKSSGNPKIDARREKAREYGLVLDHIHNNGAFHRKEAGLAGRGNPYGARIYEHIRKSGKIDGLQVLCANCNMIKQIRHWRDTKIKDAKILAEIRAFVDNINPS